MRAALVLLLACGFQAACSRAPADAAPPGTQPANPPDGRAAAVASPALRSPRSADPELAKLRAHIDFGRLEQALALAPALEKAGPEAALLRARLAALSGRIVEAIRLVEAARRERPRDPDVHATAAEIYAAAGKVDTGWDEVRAGLSACGEGPELSRARGVLLLSRQGGAKKGLAHLEEARRGDPGLPFVERALSQAHLLIGKELAAAGKPADALAQAREAAGLDPEDVDARRFLAESQAGVGDFDAAIRELEGLLARGEPLGSELALTHKKAGIAALLERDRDRALACFAAARRLGLRDDELSTGARILEEEAAARTMRGVDAYRASDLASAEARFREALELDPEHIEAKNHLAVVLFRREDFPGAIELWKGVLATAQAEGIELPEPVHVNLAKAQAHAGDLQAARTTLEEYLAREPPGPYAEETRAALLALPARKAGD